MAITYLKSASVSPEVAQSDVRDMVQVVLANIRRNGEEEVRRYAAQFQPLAV